jgi:hypothetical protein
MKIKTRIAFILVLLTGMIIPARVEAQSDYEKQTASFSIDLAKKIKESGKTKVAVSDFLDNDGNLTELGKAIAEDIGVGIVNEGKGAFQVMERSNLNAILKEQKLSSSGLIDPETAKQLGKLKMVDAVIVGNITPFGSSFRVTIKILDTETGMSIAATSGNLAGIDDIKGLFNKKITIFNPASPDSENKNTKTKPTGITPELAVSEMGQDECVTVQGINGATVWYYGKVCFENQTEYDLVLSNSTSEGNEELKLIIPKGGKNCWPREIINRYGSEITARDFKFTFTMRNTAIKKKGVYTLTLEKCKLKSVVLTNNNLYFE